MEVKEYYMLRFFKRLFSVARCVGADTHLWCISVLGAAILLCTSFFVEPAHRQLVVTGEADKDRIATQKVIEYSSVLGSLSGIESLEDHEVEEIVEAIPDTLPEPEYDDVGVFDEDTIQEEEAVVPTAGEALPEAVITPVATVPVAFDMLSSYSLEEIDALERLVQCEASGEDLDGRKLVAQVVLNRVNTGIWGNDILSVIKSPGQFKPVSNGAYKVCDVDQLTKDAVVSALSGEDISKGAIYFQKSRATVWGNKVYLFRHGSHSFYK